MQRTVNQQSLELKFFRESARTIQAYLQAAYHPQAAELARWMSTPEEIDARLQNTPYAAFLSPNAPEQRGGVRASLAELGRP